MILDASAVLALLQAETGAEQVQASLPKAIISTVNWAEVVQKLSVFDASAADIRPELAAAGLKIIPFSAQQAEICASLWAVCKPYGLSLGDRACLALGIQKNKPVLTADKAWAHLSLPIPVIVIR